MNVEDVMDIVDEWRRPIEQEVEKHKGIIDQLNTMTVVAVFIAGVQAQLLAISLGLPTSTLVRLTNIFLFLGLSFEISGIAMGATHSLLLQDRIKSTSRALDAFVRFRSDMRVVLKGYFRAGGGCRRPGRVGNEGQGSTGLNQVMEKRLDEGLPDMDGDEYKRRLQSGVDFIKQVSTRPESQLYILKIISRIAHRLNIPITLPLEETERHRRQPSTSVKTRIIRYFQTIIEENPAFGLIFQSIPALTIFIDLEPSLGEMPMVSMNLGVICLGIATALLAASLDSLGVRIAIGCAVIFLGVVFASQVPILMLLVKDAVRIVPAVIRGAAGSRPLS